MNERLISCKTLGAKAFSLRMSLLMKFSMVHLALSLSFLHRSTISSSDFTKEEKLQCTCKVT